LNWVGTGANGYNVRYASAGTGAWTTLFVTGTSVSITGLSPSTAYIWQVQSVCGTSSTPTLSAWSPLNTFQTTSIVTTCGTPTGVTVSVVGNQSALIAWNVVSGAVSYNIRYRASTNLNWTTITTNNASVQIGPLTPNTLYELQVQAVCVTPNGVATLSSWSQPVSFSTPLRLMLVPNPADQEVALTFDAEVSGNATIEIRDLYGKVVHGVPVQFTEGTNQVYLSTGWLKEGLYTLILNTNSERLTERLLISR
jgi:hypothetical protein